MLVRPASPPRNPVKAPARDLRGFGVQFQTRVEHSGIDPLVRRSQRAGTAVDFHDDLRIRRDQSQKIGIDPVIVSGHRCHQVSESAAVDVGSSPSESSRSTSDATTRSPQTLMAVMG